MKVCEFDSTETTLEVCPTCNEHKGLTTPERTSIAGMTLLGIALDDVFALMDEARAFADENCNHQNDWCEHAVEDEI